MLIVAALYFGIDPSFLIGNAPVAGTNTTSGPVDRSQDPLVEMVSVVMADTEAVWGDIFAESGERYREPVLVIFTDSTQSACGVGQAAMGPFYCPADQKAYIDLSFYEQMHRQARRAR